ncbi:MAG: Xaa-Pro peptidase family protein [Chloroflexota bacterium]|nr:Xaa-Pro peptidase family protein [Chloroflexota bacterium]
MDYPRRLTQVREAMGERGIDLLFLPRAANLFWLTGVRREPVQGTDHNAYGDWVAGGYIGLDGPVPLVAPRMGGAFYVEEAAGKPWFEGVRLVLEPEDPLDVMRETLAGFGLANGGCSVRIAVDERTWAQTTLAMQGLIPGVVLSSASELLGPLRMIKDDDEIAAMRRASEVADRVFEVALAALGPGVTEQEAAHEIDRAFLLFGAEYTSFPTGVYFAGEGPLDAAGTLREGRRALQPGDSVMFDFGGVVDGYCSDFGRSAFLGEPSADYLGVHETVRLAQTEAMKAMVAGRCTTAEANAIARRVIADAGYDAGFTHRLGHGIGVTVHEPPFLDGVEQTVLQDQMTFTVEPSIILPGRFGNRVEDVVLITPEGGVPLGNVDRGLYVVG